MRLLSVLALAAGVALPSAVSAQHAPVLAEAGSISIADGYAISAGPTARSGAAFMAITNAGDTVDRLVAARTPAAERVELHTHIMSDGVAQMREVEGGIPLPPGETVMLERGGLHVMLMGLTGPLEDGAPVDLTLVFETAGEVSLTVPVDRNRVPNPDAAHQH
jgi:periplasmic copper chaperone A